MKRWKGAALLLLCTVVLLRLLQGLAQPEKENAHVPVLGIVTTAAEDDRREAQSEALVHAAEEHGFKVLEMPVERTQEAQIEAVRALIVYQVDAIAFTPLVESGWDNVLREAKSASVPLLSIDRAIRGVDDVPLQHIGFDYASLAEQAADALLQQRMPRDGVLAQPEKENAHVPVLGIVTTAAEDDRREAQSEALVHAAEEHGFKVLEMPVERTQEAQIEAVRALIVYQVDAIAFTPLVESGWDNVLREAKSASVPLLSIDRAIRGVDDVPLQHIGFDYASLAEQAADALLQQRMPRDGVLELYGTVNASDAREIARGCRASLEEHGLTVTYSLCGDGMRSRGCEILEEMEDHLDEIGYIFAQNDAMALGAVDYLHSHGRKPGKDVLICAFGGGAELRALQKKGEVAVIGALDDTQLAELTADAAQQIAKAPWKPYIALADTAVVTEEGTADA